MSYTKNFEDNKEFNGYIYFDPRIEVGDKVIIDGAYSTCGEVIVMQLGNIFARVRIDDMEWSVIRNRLEAKI